MGKKEKKKDKKIKGMTKTLAKTEKNALRRMKKESAAQGEDLDALIASIQENDRKLSQIDEKQSDPPSARSGLSLCPHPERDELFFFGGEYFNGNKTQMYNELYVYNIKKDKWTSVRSPNGPSPRCSHQAVVSPLGGGQMWVFGGEFSSPTHSQFHHFSDLWVLHLNNRHWEQVKAKGGPSPRSGHRMVLLDKKLVVFGGFNESHKDYKYFNDLYFFDLEERKWSQPELTGTGPCSRSGMQMTSTTDGRVCIYGGYSREKLKKEVDKGNVHTDMFILQPVEFGKKGDETPSGKWKWINVRHSGTRPLPRCGFSVVSLSPNNRALFFGGVHDEEDEESLEGHFYNDFYFLDIEQGRWTKGQLNGTEEAWRKRHADNLEADPTKELEVEKMTLEQPIVISQDDIFTVTVGPQGASSSLEEEEKEIEDGVKAFAPHSRMNASLVHKRGKVYLYGGTYEDGDKQITFSDFYSLDLRKMDEWKTLVALDPKTQEWLESESEGEESTSEESDVTEEEMEQDADS